MKYKMKNGAEISILDTVERTLTVHGYDHDYEDYYDIVFRAGDKFALNTMTLTEEAFDKWIKEAENGEEGWELVK